MPRRTPFAIAAAAVALSAALAGCGGSKDGTAANAPTATPTASIDPFAFEYVPYPTYKEAARQTGLRPDVVKGEYGFQAGIATLCRSLPADYTNLLDEIRKEASTKDEPGNTQQAMIDEVSLRLGLACSKRMSDWIEAGGGSAAPTEEPEPVESPDETASAEPTESAGTGSDHSGDDSGSHDSGSEDAESGGSATADPDFSESNFGPARLDGLTVPQAEDGGESSSEGSWVDEAESSDSH